MPVFRLFHLDFTPRELPRSEEADEARFRAGLGEIDAAVRLGLYSEIARVDARDIHRVFPLTNHIDADWTNGPAILSHSGPARSTSVGDIVLETETGKIMSCAPIGWAELTPEAAALFRENLGGDISEITPPAAPEPGPS